MWQILANFLWDRIYCYLSFEKESDNFCVLFTYSIKRARKIRKVSCRSGEKTAKKCTKLRYARAKLLFFNMNILFFAVLLAFAVVEFFVSQK